MVGDQATGGREVIVAWRRGISVVSIKVVNFGVLFIQFCTFNCRLEVEGLIFQAEANK